VAREVPVLTVGVDVEDVEVRLRAGGLGCPDCAGVLAPWGRARQRRVRLDLASAEVESITPRRGRCGGCGRTHVLAPVNTLGRRADGVDVVGAALLDRVEGLGYRQIAARVGRPVSTVRGWLSRMSSNAERVRVAFTLLRDRVDDDVALLCPAGSVLADAVAAIGAAAAAVRRAWGTAVVVLSAWQVASALTLGRLLAPVPPARLTNTSAHLVGLT
jgi:Homeodomain-like domain